MGKWSPTNLVAMCVCFRGLPIGSVLSLLPDNLFKKSWKSLMPFASFNSLSQPNCRCQGMANTGQECMDRDLPGLLQEFTLFTLCPFSLPGTGTMAMSGFPDLQDCTSRVQELWLAPQLPQPQVSIYLCISHGDIHSFGKIWDAFFVFSLHLNLLFYYNCLWLK